MQRHLEGVGVKIDGAGRFVTQHRIEKKAGHLPNLFWRGY